MKTFTCSNCKNPVFFENDTCLHCSSNLGYWAARELMIATTPSKDFTVSKGGEILTMHYCDNHKYGGCNWLVPKISSSKLCEACDLNGTIPNLDNDNRLEEWQKIENAKHRLIYSLRKLELPLKFDNNGQPLALEFDFLAPDVYYQNNDEKLLTGHQSGLITLNVDEADDAKREALRVKMGEKFRTLLGHFRHEIGHFYWEGLILPYQDRLEAFRKVFGDERADYGNALETYYKNGPDPNWQKKFITKYASAHPWEDWAETWAHYLHIMDALETAYYFGLEINNTAIANTPKSNIRIDPYTALNIEEMVNCYIPLTTTINAMNRGMGLSDIYPFVIREAIIDKMDFIHNLVLRKIF
ncbi:MAG: putative zinc-binding metallopeptidase [Leeuwenhoekiella sp.]